MQALRELPGGKSLQPKDDVSGVGSIVLGVGNSIAGSEAFIGDPANDMRNLKDMLVGEYGMNLTS